MTFLTKAGVYSRNGSNGLNSSNGTNASNRSNGSNYSNNSYGSNPTLIVSFTFNPWVLDQLMKSRDRLY